jgi:hypothetical protein
MNDSLIGKKLDGTWGGASGRSAEGLLKKQGVKLQNGAGADNCDTGMEYKTRNLDATSPVSVGACTIRDIETKEYEETHIFEKLQHQKWYYTKKGIVVDEQSFDFKQDYIQQIFKQDFNCIKNHFHNDPFSLPSYIKGVWGYWEYIDDNTYCYRMSWSKMKKVKAISRQANIFENF